MLREILKQLVNTLREDGEIDERESFIDATFASAKGGGDGIGKTRRGKGVKVLAIVDRHRLPLSVSTHVANHHEVTWLVERFFAWLQWKGRLLVRWEYYAANFLGFVQLASITMLLKRF